MGSVSKQGADFRTSTAWLGAALALIAAATAGSCARTQAEQSQQSEVSMAGSARSAGSTQSSSLRSSGAVDAATVPQTAPTAKQPFTAKPLFGCHVANFAWGSVAYGNVLDDEGHVWFYDLGRTWSDQPAGDGLFLGSALRERFAGAELQPMLPISSAQLDALRKKALIAKTGSIARKQHAVDAGGAGCEAYIWERADAYRRIELGEMGDYAVTNSRPEAHELEKALRDIFHSVRSRPAPKKTAL